MGESVIFTGIWGIIGKEKAPNGVGLIETLDVFKFIRSNRFIQRRRRLIETLDVFK